LFKKIFEVKKKIEQLSFGSKEELQDYLNDNVLGWKNIFSIHVAGQRLQLKRDDNAIGKKLDRMGTTILITNKKISPHDGLSLYRRKNRVEKFFDSMKNEMDRKRLRTHNIKASEGRLFVDFLALILHSHIAKVARQENIVKELSVQKIMYELKKIKLVRLGEKKTIITEISKKQRELFDKFKIKPLS